MAESGPNHHSDSTALSAALTTPQLIAAAARRWPDNDLVVFDEQRLSYREAERRSALLARRLLAAGVGKSTRVGILFPNSIDFVISYLAVTRIGAIAIPLSTFSTAAELAQLIRHADLHSLILISSYLKHDYIQRVEQALPSLRDSRSQYLTEAPYLRRIWVWGDQAPAWASATEDAAAALAPQAVLESVEREIYPSDLAAIIYTSGSTGEPKGVVHTQGSLLRQSIKQAVEKGYTSADRIFSSMPFFWVGGLSYKLLPAMQSGATVMGCQSQAPVDILDFIEREGMTMFLGWPHAGQALENAPGFAGRNLSSVRGGYLFGALPADQRPADLDSVGNALGMTETAGPHTAGHLSPLPDELRGSFGWAADGIEHRVIDWETGEDVADGELGELLVRGDTLMQGLYKKERGEVFTADGWYPTKDLVVRRQGHLFFQGRRDDVVKIKGANVSPKEVEDALNALPGVAQSIVTGVTNNGALKLGAIVVTAPGTEVDIDAIPAKLREQLSAYKVPSVYASIPASELPFRSSGKVDRPALLKLLQQEPAEA